jgi:archaellum component FlaF (FlaF/FlaG flagellin family)
MDGETLLDNVVSKLKQYNVIINGEEIADASTVNVLPSDKITIKTPSNTYKIYYNPNKKDFELIF